MSNGILFVMSFLDGLEPPVGETVFNPDHLHVTLLPESTVPHEMLRSFTTQLQQYSLTMKPFTVEETGVAVFGDNTRSVPVTLLGKNEYIVDTHNGLLGILNNCGGAPIKPFVGNKFSPHISFNNFIMGRKHIVKSFSLIHHRGGLGADVHNIGNYQFGG